MRLKSKAKSCIKSRETILKSLNYIIMSLEFTEPYFIFAGKYKCTAPTCLDIFPIFLSV